MNPARTSPLSYQSLNWDGYILDVNQTRYHFMEKSAGIQQVLKEVIAPKTTTEFPRL
jgi:CheY-like chemotaxis protein